MNAPARPLDGAQRSAEADSRDETPLEKLDRNWNELLQELRVVQTGVQFLTGFLLTLPFQQRFSSLDAHEQLTYVCALGLAIASTALIIAPVALHRKLFRQHARPELVEVAHRLARGGYTALGLAIVAATMLIFDVVEGFAAGIAAAALAAVLVFGLWMALPAWLRRRHAPGQTVSGAGSRPSSPRPVPGGTPSGDRA